MPKVIKSCEYCSKPFESYASAGRRVCGTKCRSHLPKKKMDIQKRIAKHSKVMPNGCIEWIGAKRRKNGYGSIEIDGVSRAIHRVVYEMEYGPIPPGLCVLHKCDNPPCFNIDHLEIGTHVDNINDKVNKNRHPKGETHGQAKLTEKDIAEIIAAKTNGHPHLNALAKKFCVSKSLVSAIANNKLWKHIAKPQVISS